MISVGDKVYFMRGKERCEGFCVVEAVDPRTKQVSLSPIPEGVQAGDWMVWEGEMDLNTRRIRQ